MGVGTRIKQYIEDNGIKQSYLSRVTKIPEAKLSLSLNEKRKFNFEEYEVLCFCLNVDTNRFIKPKDPKELKKGA